MNKRMIILILVLLFAISICFRTISVYDDLVTDGIVRFSSVDAYYHMRIVDNIVHNFPLRTNFDIYLAFPEGSAVTWAPLFDWLIAFAAIIVGMGNPSQYVVDMVGAFFPAILGALLVFPVYFVGRKIFKIGRAHV